VMTPVQTSIKETKGRLRAREPYAQLTNHKALTFALENADGRGFARQGACSAVSYSRRARLSQSQA